MRLAPLILLPLLAACVAEPPTPLPAPVDSCGAGRYAGLVGNPLSTFDASQVRGPLRILAPGAVATMDYRQERLNIWHNARGIVEKVTCG